ncbi:MAG: Phosphoribosylaminoimidazole-succinocarboxamide synthase [candidate division TA06 bacterium ADurb.Bin131]|uniref:Phosphoribosylaminoimidazole-succinocarboxamide synthase n=1 Tax=candidate division TA06 bacterium ADurb.Bin131 TaxID=1852827 RepID=A0A1V6C9E1_UNCT6|nr:MAG: Phosphoribosylaminoimidazole-succinocarboxamide synthase [candidate division TA06 bacterium ADurb.Bin131]
MKPIVNVVLPIPKIYSGKVRELFKIDKERILIVTTDRISAFDFVLPTPVPEKGIILNKLSLFWFEKLRDICDNHLVESDFDKFPQILRPFKNVLEGRSIIAKKTIKIPVECVVRGYLSGSAWKEYLLTCSVCGINLPPGLRECEKLPEPIFTPATKEELGSHDRNISFEEMSGILGKEIAEYLKKVSISLYKEASDYADGKGIIIADTKFEFGFYKDRIILIDEILTPDSSRFWEKSSFRIGLSQDSLDKQYVRNYLEGLNWNKQEPVPELPDDVVEKTRQKYWQIYNILTT